MYSLVLKIQFIHSNEYIWSITSVPGSDRGVRVHQTKKAAGR